MQLRPYQIESKDLIRESFLKGNRSVILCAPTGSGKTVTFASIAVDAIRRGSIVVVVIDRKELLEQAKDMLFRYGLVCEIITGGSKNIDYSAKCFLATVQTLKRRKFPRADLLIIDEAHKQIFDAVVDHYVKTPTPTYIIGTTATPIRRGKRMRQLSTLYSDIVEPVTISSLIKGGYLSTARTYGAIIETEKVKIKGGEYDPEALFGIYDKPFLYAGLVEKYVTLVPRTKALCFCINVEHSKKTCQEFVNHGINAVHIDGYMPMVTRSQIIKRFSEGGIQVLCNVQILTTGFDDPSIKTIIVNRRTRSLPLWLQMCGRGSRTFDDVREFNVLDFGGNTIEHGFWEKDRKYSLIHRVGTSGIAPIKRCPDPKIIEDDDTYIEIAWQSLTERSERQKFGCGAIVPASAAYCPECGRVFPKKEREIVEAEFAEFNNFEDLPKYLQKPYRSMEFEELMQVKELRGYKIGWVYNKIREADPENVIKNLAKFGDYMGYKKGWIHYQKPELFT